MITVTGKNVASSENVETIEKHKSDLFETSYSLTRLLLNELKEDPLAISKHLPILEPACGNGAIVKVLKEFGYQVDSYDKETNFLKEKRKYQTIITNPPYSITNEFINKAKRVADQFFFLLPLVYLHGKQRYNSVFMDDSYPLKKVFVFTRCPILGDTLREDGKTKAGMVAYAWYWFREDHVGEPTIGWLDNNNYILSASDLKLDKLKEVE